MWVTTQDVIGTRCCFGEQDKRSAGDTNGDGITDLCFVILYPHARSIWSSPQREDPYPVYRSVPTQFHDCQQRILSTNRQSIKRKDFNGDGYDGWHFP